ncbi:SxtJ family membrane protein [Mucilaginibacter sp. X5P1]|uniref:SxtJ family membrane protein n=1 Tax=Mucilaginibacter sp. X5P1 TaxID=2723088 RepID=UPI00160BA0D0|nr:SxtJ family membrane protein [Mucilaginibacter sp. X5P1]MBB6140808.1 hypothetical protein [Mucilaginibacter sp. X5P1]
MRLLQDIDKRNDMSDDNRKFGFIVGGVCLVISAYKLVFHHPYFIVFGCIGAVLILAALLIPWVLNPLRILWDKIGRVLGFVNTHVILFLVFFLLITPIGFIRRLRNKNLLGIKKVKNKNSYWQPVNIAENSSLKQQF